MYKLLVISTDGDKRVCIDAEYSTCDHDVSLTHDCTMCDQLIWAKMHKEQQ